MNYRRVLKIGLLVESNILPIANSNENILPYLLLKKNRNGQIAVLLADYFVKHLKIFEDVSFFLTDDSNNIVGKINRSEIDVISDKFAIIDGYTRGNFTYPFYLDYHSFMIQKPKYKPEINGLFKAFSIQTWIAIIASLVLMFLIFYLLLKGKYTFEKILLQVISIFLRQNFILRPSSGAEKMLVYSWVVGSMFIFLAYSSVFLSFLVSPPMTRINNASQLSVAVENGDYHCICPPLADLCTKLLRSDDKHLKIIGLDIQTNKLNKYSYFEDFYYDRNEINLAFAAETNFMEVFNVGQKIILKDRFLGMMSAMVVRKDFCCKKQLETFVHRLLDSGLFFKFEKDTNFFNMLPAFFVVYAKVDTSIRSLTLVDIAPGFIFLLIGYFLAIVTFFCEILSYYKKKLYLLLLIN